MKDFPKKRCIPFLQTYARIEREKAIEDFDRKMKLWRWIHDTSENAPPPDLGDGETFSMGSDSPITAKTTSSPKAPRNGKVQRGPRGQRAPKAPKAPRSPRVPRAPRAQRAPRAPKAPKAPRAPRAPRVPKAAKEPTVTRAKPGPKPKEALGGDRRRRARTENPEPKPPQSPTPNYTYGAEQWKARNHREADKRVSRPSRIMRERETSEDWMPPSPPPMPVRARSVHAGEHKRIRLTYTEEQVDILRGAFDREQYATREIKEELAERTGLTVTQVNKWFENRRKRERDERKAREAQIF